MNRRNFLKSLGALGLAPAVRIPAFAATSVVTTIPAATYQWAETIVRAHKTCNLAMLQRHLRLDTKTASFLQSQLIKNGVISAQANAYGIRAATNPLFDGLFTNTKNPATQLSNSFENIADKSIDRELESDTLPSSEDETGRLNSVEIDSLPNNEPNSPDVFELNDHGELIGRCVEAQMALETSFQSVTASQLSPDPSF